MEDEKVHIVEKFIELKRVIKDYESDTFSAEGSELTDLEAETIAERLIIRAIQHLIDCDSLDGIDITEELEAIRE